MRAQRAVNGLRAAGVADDDITIISGEPFEDQRVRPPRHARPGCGTSPASAALVGLRVRHLADADDRARLAAADRQHADRRVVAEPDRHLRDDDARRHSGDGAHAVRHREAAESACRRSTIREVTNGKILVGVQNPPAATLPALEQALLAGGAAEVKTELTDLLHEIRRSGDSSFSSRAALASRNRRSSAAIV